LKFSPESGYDFVGVCWLEGDFINCATIKIRLVGNETSVEVLPQQAPTKSFLWLTISVTPSSNNGVEV